ncbi:hypothetical protein SODALDRAFT_374580 [Sodiomyces alkalinus F11]|uniref:Uncharacterized protein n=1 Tax=Sodiomyces alkalinus (strain CBS 110278 / VKM F-3762 / F11) TaxID=1314773 RepID=A0A3N2Q690_SODAK|nr:hypothetical protein SODALDRAFT_374580 [Sodiomyces alkalinus F11]ROT42226.1 hypothetical protein SODALDRAFT_374580 [Sodiomyces alkalinus F11]
MKCHRPRHTADEHFNVLLDRDNTRLYTAWVPVVTNQPQREFEANNGTQGSAHKRIPALTPAAQVPHICVSPPNVVFHRVPNPLLGDAVPVIPGYFISSVFYNVLETVSEAPFVAKDLPRWHRLEPHSRAVDREVVLDPLAFEYFIDPCDCKAGPAEWGCILPWRARWLTKKKNGAEIVVEIVGQVSRTDRLAGRVYEGWRGRKNLSFLKAQPNRKQLWPSTTMGKLAKQADPLRAGPSRVEKSRAQRDSRILPMECYDFDEDLSELEEDNEQRDDAEQLKEEEGEDCECRGRDPECDCQFEDGDDMDDESERSYDGSDADDYYELKEEREERKWEKLRERKEKDPEQQIERTKEEEVRAAYGSFRKAEKEHKTIPIESLGGQGFRLFCSNHINHFYSDFYATKRVDFYNLDGTDDGTDNPHVYLDANANCSFGPFRPPNRASRRVVKVKSCDGKYELSFMFIGNGYLKLRVSREMVFMKPYGASSTAPPPTAPEVFEFVGIWRDREKEKAERQKMMVKIRRSPSPRESWFEMNHPMGVWNQPW